MFSSMNKKKFNKSSGKESDIYSLISHGSEITGTVISDCDMRVEGSVKGSLEVKGRLIVGESGLIEAEIVRGNKVIVMGTVKGSIIANEILHIYSKGEVLGDIIVSELIIEQGACFNGACHKINPGELLEMTSKIKDDFLPIGRNGEDIINPG